jgi:beta-glucosidase
MPRAGKVRHVNQLFPPGFVWGAASSSYQIEGAHDAEGKGPSVWDAFCRRSGSVFSGHTGDIACDHYHRWREDVALMREVGLRAYRFSISWPRVFPEGTGRVNDAGLAFYDRLVDALLEAKIDPWVTLFHWDYPLALQERGGWLSAASPEWFAEYAGVIVDRLSDRVTRWMTINEPQIFIGLGHGDGTHAPGLKLDLPDRLKASHHALLAHGRAVQVIRSRARKTPSIGWAPCGRVEYPGTPNPADIDAARRSTMSITKPDSWNNTWWADPVCLGRYPEDGLALFGSAVPAIGPRDMETIRQPLDFYGVNIYFGEPVVAGDDGRPVKVPFVPGQPQTSMRWYITPQALHWGPRFLYERYRLPLVVTENGMANLDWPDETGRVRDPQRIDYTRAYLLALAEAVQAGADVRGYMYWSIMDNFEWGEGYSQRFGLVHVDFAGGTRTLKDSAAWYRGVIESNGGCLRAGGGM